MATVVITSDLHLGITSTASIQEMVRAIEAEKPDLTVLAGDVGEGLPNFRACLELFAHLPGEVAVLAGNHDIWSQPGLSSQDLWEEHLPALVKDAGMIWLEDAIWQRDGIAVVGSLAWYDYSAADSTLPSYRPGFFAGLKRYYSMDEVYIDWPWTDREFAARLGAGLCARLQGLEQDESVQAVLVASHMPLFDEQMCRNPDDFDWAFSNAYFGHLTLGEQVLKMKKVRIVVSGHTHRERDGEIQRPGCEGCSPLSVSVLASGYHSPAYLAINTDALD